MSLQPTTDPGRTLGQFGLAVAGLVVGAALLFALIGWVSDDGGTPADPGPVAATDSATPTEGTSPAIEPTTGPATTPATTAPTTGATETATTGGEVVTATPTGEATDDGGIEPPAEAIDPAEISIQVLDGIRDGGSTARDVADRLAGDGYDLVAFNNAASDYSETTLFYTEGNEDAGRQLAAEYGWSALQPNDVGLSSSVDVHVIVGSDQQ